MDLHATLPDFPTGQFAHILPALERAEVTVKELLLYDALEIAKQTQVAVTDIRRLKAHLLAALHKDLRVDRYIHNEDDSELLLQEAPEQTGAISASAGTLQLNQQCISTLDDVLDSSLAGGIRTGYVTEITGESGSGKTQLLLHLVLAVQLPPPRGLGRSALYVSTESDLATGRLLQLLESHPYLASLPDEASRPSLENIRSITTVDLESQDHILNFHVPIAVERYDVGLLVIDSITANYRAELSAENSEQLVARAWELKLLGRHLRDLAVKHNLAVVVANQISDQFGSLDDPFWGQDVDGVQEVEREDPRLQKGVDSSQAVPSSPFPESSLLGPDTGEHSQVSSLTALRDGNPSIDPLALDLPRLGSLLSLDYQKPFFTGWGDPYQSLTARGPADLKAPALGLVWTNQIACRIVLKIGETPLPVSLPTNLDAIRQDPEPNAHPSSMPPPTIPDSEGSDDGSIGDDWVEDDILESNDGTVHASRIENSPRQFPDGNHSTGSAHGLEDNNQVSETSARVNLRDVPALGTRRIRTMEVVFSPWASGSPAQNDPGDAWEDIGEEGEATAEEQEDGCSKAADPEFEPPQTAVEFEILASSIRGLRRS